MTVTEFYEWAKVNKFENYEIVVNDKYGELTGTGDPEQSVHIDHKEQSLELD